MDARLVALDPGLLVVTHLVMVNLIVDILSTLTDIHMHSMHLL